MGNPGLQAGEEVIKNNQTQKTIYTLRVGFSQEKVFDTRKPEDYELYLRLREYLKDKLAPEDWPSRNLIATPNPPGSAIDLQGYFPDFGSGLNIIPELMKLGFRALWVSEGSQGASLALMYPKDAKIISEQEL